MFVAGVVSYTIYDAFTTPVPEFVSVIAEKQECEDGGGNFIIIDHWDMFAPYSEDYESRYELSCYTTAKITTTKDKITEKWSKPI